MKTVMKRVILSTEFVRLRALDPLQPNHQEQIPSSTELTLRNLLTQTRSHHGRRKMPSMKLELGSSQRRSLRPSRLSQLETPKWESHV